VMIQRTVFMTNYSRIFIVFYMKIPFGDFNEILRRDDIFKLTIGNDSLHQNSNDNGVRIINFALQKIW